MRPLGSRGIGNDVFYGCEVCPYVSRHEEVPDVAPECCGELMAMLFDHEIHARVAEHRKAIKRGKYRRALDREEATSPTRVCVCGIDFKAITFGRNDRPPKQFCSRGCARRFRPRNSKRASAMLKNRNVQLDGFPLPLEKLEPIDGEPMSCREIGLMAGISRQRVEQIEKRAIRKLRAVLTKQRIGKGVME